MKSIYNILIFYCGLFFLSLSHEEEQIFYKNPVNSKLEYNPIDYIIIVESELLGNKTNILKYYDYYLVTKRLYLFNDKSNNSFILVNDKFYSISEQNNEYIFTYRNTIGPVIDFYGFITLDECLYVESGKIYQSNIEEIGIYGREKFELDFYFLSEGIMKNDIFKDSDNFISCKSYQGAIYICAFFRVNREYLKILIHNCGIPVDKEKEDEKIINLEEFLDYDSAILYDTNIYNKKIVCAKTRIIIILNVLFFKLI